MRAVLVAGFAGCAPVVTDPPPVHPCDQAVGRLDVAPPHGEFGDLVSGGPLWCGNPPQGGAPYSPFRLRIAGDVAFGDGVLVEMTAADTSDGSELAYTSLTMGLTCANVGESEGMWVGSEAHLRYEGYLLADLDGRSAEVTFRATSTSDPTVSAESRFNVELVLE